MKKMTVTFKDDHTLSYDGINVKEYKKGEVYVATHPQEQRVFESMVDSGSAEVYTEKQVEPKEVKVVTPKAKKAK